MQNFYNILPKEYLHKKQNYKNYDKIKIDLPMRMIIVGASGSMKSNTMMNLLSQISAWEKIYLITKNPSEPLYQYLQDSIRDVEQKTGHHILTVGTDVDEIPPVDDFSVDHPSIIIIDDQIAEKEAKLQTLNDHFVRSRKNGVSLIFISQSYFRINRLIRQNASHIIMKNLASKKDLDRILAEYSLDLTKDQLLNKYKQATQKQEDFFLLDLATLNPSLRYRRNYEPI